MDVSSAWESVLWRGMGGSTETGRGQKKVVNSHVGARTQTASAASVLNH